MADKILTDITAWGAESIEEQELEICADLAKKDKRIASLEAALRSIAEHPHCHWNDPYCGNAANVSCDDRDVYGHRCAAEIAKRALGQKE